MYCYIGPADYLCDNLTHWNPSPDWRGPGWYRITGAAGVKMPEKSPTYYHCGTYEAGWMRGVHPTTPGQESEATACFAYGDTDCHYPTTISVRNCGDYYIYNLPETPWGVAGTRYCGSHGH